MRLYILDFGLMRLAPVAPGRDDRLPVVGFLLRTDNDQRILIDTGFPERYAVDPSSAMADDNFASSGPPLALTEEHLLPAQLARVGMRPEDLSSVILSHSDIDHMGGLEFIPRSVPVLIARAERELERPDTARALAARAVGERHTAVWPDREFVVVDPDLELRPEITLLNAPGHSAGHMAVLLRLKRTGPTLLPNDAIPTAAATTSMTAVEPAVARESADRLRALARRERAWIVYAHDFGQRRHLRMAPAFYD